MAKLIYPNGRQEDLDHVPHYTEAAELLARASGITRHLIVELVAPKQTPSVIFLCDEEFLLYDDQEVNPLATVLYNIPGRPYSPILGPIILIERKEPGAVAWLE